MSYVMVTRITGTRDGVDWPKPGEPVDLPPAEAEQLAATGHIRRAPEPEHATPPAPEHAARPAPEQATPPAPETRPRRGR